MKGVLLFVFSILFSISSVFGQTSPKIKGLSFVGSSSPISAQDVNPIIEMNANWVTLMPYGFVGNDGKVAFNSSWQWWGEKNEGIRKTIELCQAANLKIMLKPQIWMMNAYTGDYKLDSEKKWVIFENSYRDFILNFLDIAVEKKLEMFCIGTEWREFIAARPSFWKKLIQTIKLKYTGDLIYAANWDDYEAVPFWSELDYVGVNGYFPLSYDSDPKLADLVIGWQVHSKKLKSFSTKTKKKIIFTEIGYRSILGAATRPWEHGTKGKYAPVVQDRAFQALFSVVWKETWLEGMFIWKWYHDHAKQGGVDDLDFTPQNKPAAETIKSYWAK